MTTTSTGSCFCKVIQYRITSPIPLAVNCHCNSCKKAGGGAFSSLDVVREEHLEITSGETGLAAYRMGKHVTKHFCSLCGTPIFNRNQRYPGRCMAAFGSLDDPAGVAPSTNSHCKNRLAWTALTDKLQNFAQDYR